MLRLRLSMTLFECPTQKRAMIPKAQLCVILNAVKDLYAVHVTR